MTEETTKKIIDQMRAQGNQPGIIRIFKLEMEMWAKLHSTQADAKAILAWLPNFPDRPFYTARELVPLFPALALALGYERNLRPQKSSKRLAHELEFYKLPKLMNVRGSYNFWHPIARYSDEFFIVEHVHKWRKLALTQAQFEAEF